MKRAVLVMALTAMAAPALADLPAAARAQLEAAAGISKEERGKYSSLQLRNMVAVQSRSSRFISEGQRQRQLDIIKAGRSFTLKLGRNPG